jgi:hypothetical protein
LAVLRQLFSLADVFPPTAGASRMSALHEEPDRFRAFVIGDETVVTLSDIVSEQGGACRATAVLPLGC